MGNAESRCPVCGDVFEGDEAAFQHHVNLHFEVDISEVYRGDGEGTVYPPRSASITEWTLNSIPLDEEGSSVYQRVKTASVASSRQCESCFSLIDTTDWQAHQDFHLAQCLQNEEIEFSVAAADTASIQSNLKDGGDMASRKSSIRWKDESSTQQDISPLTLDVPPSSTLGVIPALFETLERAHSRAYLSSHHTPYVTTQKGVDLRWGCGYRNLQMMLIPLVIHDAAGQDSPLRGLRHRVPQDMNIAWIQHQLEAAWSQGYDPIGRDHFQGCIVGTCKWLGATDVSALLAFLGVKTTIYDFQKPTGPRGQHPRLMDICFDYFETAAALSLSDAASTLQARQRKSSLESNKSSRQSMDTTQGNSRVGCLVLRKPPLFLQHQDHSRTIVGVEETRDGHRFLLCFDPSIPPPFPPELARPPQDFLRCFRLDPRALSKHAQYQLVAVDSKPGLLTKDVRSVRIA